MGFDSGEQTDDGIIGAPFLPVPEQAAGRKNQKDDHPVCRILQHERKNGGAAKQPDDWAFELIEQNCKFRSPS